MEKTKKGTGSILAVLLKSTKFFKLFKLAKFLKPLITILTMSLSVIAYSPRFGFYFALIFVILIFIHEMGHTIALKKLGFPINWPIFIPFLGAVIFAPKFEDRNKEAIVGIGGPLLGTLGAFLCLIPFYFTNHFVWLSLTIVGIYINAFNMVPISPLDGGRITQAVSKHMKWIGIIALIVFTLHSKDPGMLVVWMLILSDFNIRAVWKLIYSSLLVVLMLILVFCFNMTHDLLWIDFILAGLFWGFALLHFYTGDDDEEIKVDNRIVLSTKQRVLWGISWLVLLSIQVVAIIYLLQLIPKK
jgi:Zn-dependent protease